MRATSSALGNTLRAVGRSTRTIRSRLRAIKLIEANVLKSARAIEATRRLLSRRPDQL